MLKFAENQFDYENYSVFVGFRIIVVYRNACSRTKLYRREDAECGGSAESVTLFLSASIFVSVAPMIEDTDGEVFADPKALNTISPSMNGFCSPFKDEDISVEMVEAEGKKIYVWKFPEPEYLREALYLAFVPVDGHYKAYAICVGQLVDWEISTSSEKSRATYGRVKRPENATECVELLIERGALTGEIKMGDFIQGSYKSPSYRE